MRTERTSLASLLVVALAAAVLSFAALRHLAVACGTPTELAWLWPVTIDAAAVVATRTWLAGSAPERARRSARTLALIMIAASVAGNATDHFLQAYGLTPPWWLVTVVAAVPPAVLGAVAHLAALLRVPATPTARESGAAPAADQAIRSDPDAAAEKTPAAIPAGTDAAETAGSESGRHHLPGEAPPVPLPSRPTGRRARNQKADGRKAREQVRAAVERDGRPEVVNARWVASVLEPSLAERLSKTTLKVIAQELKAAQWRPEDTQPMPALVGSWSA